MPQATRHRSADVAVGYAADPTGHGIVYATIATGSGRAVVKLPFTTPRLPALEGRDAGYAAVAAIGSHLRTQGFTRVRLRLGDEAVVAGLNARAEVPPALAMAYVKTRCLLRGFALARVERAEPVETHELESQARADLGQRRSAAAA